MARLDGSWWKFQRAYDQLGDLSSKVGPYLESRPFKLVRDESESNASQAVVRFVITQKPEPLWAVQLGEVVHDLRSALDHAVYQLVIDNGGIAREKGTGFPICERDTDFLSPGRARAGLNLLQGLPDDAVAFVTSIQPYQALKRGSDPKQTMLWVLNEMWNIDKHRLLHMLVLGAVAESVEYQANVPVTEAWIGSRVLKHGAEILRVRTGAHLGGKMEVNVEITARIVIEETMPAPVTYNEVALIGNEVRDVLRILNQWAMDYP